MTRTVFGLPILEASAPRDGFEPLTTETTVAELAYFNDGSPAGPVLALLAQAHAAQGAVLVEFPRGGFELWVPANQIKKGSDLL